MLVATYTEQVQNLYAAFRQGDLDTILSRLDEKISWEAPAEGNLPWGGVYAGVGGFMDWLETYARYLDVQFFEPRDFFEQEGKVTVFVYNEATMLNNGRKLINPEVHYWTFQGDKVVRF